ncbi:ATP-binding cassette domain-containing protein [Nonomuraea phyllanthi]|uniref:ABC transporter ATP-binding protein n=1 Tax=Nonomuraea phyllanthi TaxID=2219224 RepID=UPI0012930E3E|nr:ABC transporter ATP-binding protein [Nonomuraea phyllanthi]QFY12001.1 ATP-binding cassette domain-containing protein [Nonomuraea phyllanthi]
MTAEPALLRVTNLVKRFRVPGGVVEAVSGVGFSVRRGQTLGLVGESGCGKSTTGRAVLQLPPPDEGSVRFGEEELTVLSRRDLRRVRSRLQIVWQDPRSALNPGRRVRDLVAEGLVIAGHDRRAAGERVDAALAEVGLDPSAVGGRRPHEFSGGQCQRIAIARALVLEPELLICDEPVASLDVSVQAQVINLLRDVRAAHGLSMLFISHDLGVVHNVSDRVAVMYLGRIVEIGEVGAVYGSPAHPYTRALLDAVPVPDPDAPPPGPPLRGEVPSPLSPPSGCRFRTRCPLARPLCAERAPELRDIGDDHQVACHFSPEGGRP